MENKYLEICKEEIQTAIDNIQNDCIEGDVDINIDADKLAEELNNSFEVVKAFSVIYETAELLIKKEMNKGGM